MLGSVLEWIHGRTRQAQSQLHSQRRRGGPESPQPIHKHRFQLRLLSTPFGVNVKDRALISFDTELRLVCSPSLRDHYTTATVAQHFKTYEGKPLTLPAEAAGPKAAFLEYHRNEVFGRS